MPTNEIPNGVFDFTDMLDMEAIQKIVENDEMVKDLYTKIVESTDRKTVSDLFGKKNADYLYQILKRMIEDETRHISMVKKIAGRIERIQ